MRVQTSKLTGDALNWSVAMCEGHNVVVLSVMEQRERWAECPGRRETREALLQEWDQHMAGSARPNLRVLCEDGYKRVPYHFELGIPAGCVPEFNYAGSWAQAGPIIGRERITLRVSTMEGTDWVAFYDVPGQYHAFVRQKGPTALIAAMRCYVASKLGGEVDIPEELLDNAKLRGVPR